MKAMILAAGFGTRLFPLTIDRTKPAIPFLGKPLVGYVAEYLAEHGFDDIVVNLHYQPDSVISALGDGSSFGVKINYSIEQPEILGTSGALAHARKLLGDETFLVINGKIITDIDISSALETHRKSGALATMILKPNIKRERFTVVEVEGGVVRGFHGMPEQIFSPDELRNDSPPPLMFTGIQFLEPRVFDYIPQKGFSDIVPTVYKPAIEKGDIIAAHISDSRWYELSTIGRYLDISLAMIGEKNILAGKNSLISSSSHVSNTILWDNVTVSEDAVLNRTIVADDVTIPKSSVFENAALVRADVVRNCTEIPEKAPKGYFKDDIYVVPLD